MRRVAIVGADFAPSSYPPALRIRFFVRHLPEFGYEPVVVTTRPHLYDWAVDPEIERLVPEGLRVVRTAALPSKLTRWAGIGDVGMRSLGHHWRALARLCRNKEIDLVMVPVPPFVPMVLGRLANLRFGVPYVVDYIDPWVIEYYWKLPRKQRPPKWPLAYALSRILEPFSLRRVSHIIGVAEGYTAGVIERYPWLSASDATSIPYGGEPADFEYLSRHPRCNPVFDRNDGLRHMSYVGRGGVDMVPTLRALFQAVRLGLERAPDVFSRLRLHFIGTTYAANAEGLYQVLPVAQEAGVAEYVDERPGRISYLDALQILIESHALLALGSETPYYTASKIFPILLARRPLLAIFHEASSVVSILQDVGADRPITFPSADALKTQVNHIMGRLHDLLLLPAGSQPSWNPNAFAPYTTRAMAGRLAHVFDQVLDRHRSQFPVPPLTGSLHHGR